MSLADDETWLRNQLAEQNVAPLQLCKTCGTNTEFYQCWCEKPVACFEGAHQASYLSEQSNSVATVTRCELGEHCRCKSFDSAYQQDCWNWISEVKL